MATSENLNNLRQQALNRHRAATQKVSRLRNVVGVEIGGTEYDPRVPAADIRKMNSRQARAHLARLESFMSRSNGFERAANAKPIPRANAVRYRTAQNKNYALGQKQKAAFASIKLPNGTPLGKALADREAMLKMGTTTGNRAFMDRKRKSFGGVMGVKELDQITRSIEKKNSPAYLARHRSKVRQNLVNVLEKSGGSPAMLAAAKKLTPYQADVLWNYHPNFAQKSGERYTMTVTQEGRARPIASDADTEQWQIEQIEWASKLQEERPVAQSPRGRRR